MKGAVYGSRAFIFKRERTFSSWTTVRVITKASSCAWGFCFPERRRRRTRRPVNQLIPAQLMREELRRRASSFSSSRYTYFVFRQHRMSPLYLNKVATFLNQKNLYVLNSLYWLRIDDLFFSRNVAVCFFRLSNIFDMGGTSSSVCLYI